MGETTTPYWTGGHTTHHPFNTPTDLSMMSLKQIHSCRRKFGSHHVVDVEDDGLTGHSAVLRERGVQSFLKMNVCRMEGLFLSFLFL